MSDKIALEEILQDLKPIFKAIKIDINNRDFDFLNEDLLGDKIQMNAVDLLYVYFEIEKIYKIAIPKEFIMTDGFRYLSKIAQMIYLQLQKK
jgi:peptide maturation system acyl carrier-related protein